MTIAKARKMFERFCLANDVTPEAVISKELCREDIEHARNVIVYNMAHAGIQFWKISYIMERKKHNLIRNLNNFIVKHNLKHIGE
jgi:hypothetical protein